MRSRFANRRERLSSVVINRTSETLLDEPHEGPCVHERPPRASSSLATKPYAALGVPRLDMPLICRQRVAVASGTTSPVLVLCSKH